MSNPRKGGFTKRNDGGGPKRNNAGNSNNYNNDRAGGDKRTYPDPVLGGALSLVEQIDKKVVVVLRDHSKPARTIIGMLRSFDGYANVVLEDAFERIYVDDCFGDVKIDGWFIARAENVILVGELDEEEKDIANLKRVDTAQIKELQKVQVEKERARRKVLAEVMDDINHEEF